MKVYFAHAISDFDTDIEELMIKKIIEFYPKYEIINPKNLQIDYKFDDPSNQYLYEMTMIFLPALEDCDVVCAFNQYDNNRLAVATKKEVEYARNIGKEVVLFDCNLNIVL